MTPDAVKASYRRALTETVLLRRYTGAGSVRPKFEAAARAQVVGYAPHELVGTIVQGDRKCIVLADDLIANGWAAPRNPDGTFGRVAIVTSDFVVVRGVQLAIKAVDDSTRRINGVLIAYELQVSG
jgi:hypothetical protein